MNEHKRRASRRREVIERFNFFSAAGSEAGFGLQEKRYVRTERSRDVHQCLIRKRLSEKFVEAEQRGGRIAAAAAETRGHWNFFLEMNPHAITDPGFLKKQHRGAMHQVAGVSGQGGVATGQVKAAVDAFKSRLVNQVEGM